MTANEILAIVTPVLLSFITAFLWVGIKWAQSKAAWLEMKTAEWERMTAEAVNNSKEARKISEGNRHLIEENTELTKKIEIQGDGMQKELQQRAADAAFKSGKIKGRLEKTGHLDREELQQMEDDFQNSIQPSKK